MPPSHYWELTLPTSEEVAEGLTNLLWELGALGVVEEHTTPAPPRVRAFFAGDADGDGLAARVRDYLAALTALGFAAPGAPRVTPLADADWARAWREHFHPLPVGRRLLVVPPWETAVHADGRLVIVIEPGRAFGTGHHGSTAGCLEQLEAIVERDGPGGAIDLGTGSGILAIAAARLGVSHVLAVDTDPDAVANAAANAARNGLTDRVRGVVADAADVVAPPAPLVLANLLSAAHARLGPRYTDLVSPGGALVLGGILDGEAAALAGALRRHGWWPRGQRSAGGWTTLDLGREPAGAPLHDRT
jgi:ribosomal protein L11 methyltransferase